MKESKNKLSYRRKSIKGGKKSRCNKYYIYVSFNLKNKTIRFTTKLSEFKYLELSDLKKFKISNEKKTHINRWFKGSKKLIKEYSDKCGNGILKYKIERNNKLHCFYINKCDYDKILSIIYNLKKNSSLLRNTKTNKVKSPRLSNRKKKTEGVYGPFANNNNVINKILEEQRAKKKKSKKGVFGPFANNRTAINNILDEHRAKRSKQYVRYRGPDTKTLEERHKRILKSM